MQTFYTKNCPMAIETKVLVAIVGHVSVLGIYNLRYGAHIMGSVKLRLLFMWGLRPLTEHETSFWNVKSKLIIANQVFSSDFVFFRF